MRRWRSSKPASKVDNQQQTTDLTEYARKTAALNIRKPSLETLLRRWWVKKYQLPWTHELAQASTIPDLLVEFYEDYFAEHPEEARRVFAKDGEFYFEETGDELIDKWERELAQGLTPDLEEGMSPKEKERLKQEREKRGPRQRTRPLHDPRMASKFVRPGSADERALLGKKVLGSGLQDVGEDWTELLLGHKG